MIRLVINADDLGLHPAIDRGILRAHQEGVVTSATVLVGGKYAQQAVKSAKAAGLGLGVHLCLSTGLSPVLPAAEVRSLAPTGVFRGSWAEVARALFRQELRMEEVARELRAQVRRARALGAELDHLDAHQHLHLLPGISGVVEELARDEDLPVRWPRELPAVGWLQSPGAAAKSAVLGALSMVSLRRPARRLLARGAFVSGRLNEARLLDLLGSLEDGDHELMCHPGEEPGTVPEDPTWRYGWTAELAALCSPRVRELVRSRGIRLCTYREIFGG